MSEREFDAPHLLPCSECGIANGLDAMRCCCCGATLPGAKERQQRPLVPPTWLVADAGSAKTSSPEPGARRRKVGVTVVVAGALGAGAFVWPLGWNLSTVASQRVGGGDVQRMAPLAASAWLSELDGSTEPFAPSGRARALPVAARSLVADGAGAGERAAADRAQVVRALGFEDDRRGTVDASAGRAACRDNDVALGLCAPGSSALEQR